jgi:hypothetical protein
MCLGQRLAVQVPTEAAAREHVRCVAETLKAPYEAFNGEAFLIVPG